MGANMMPGNYYNGEVDLYSQKPMAAAGMALGGANGMAMSPTGGMGGFGSFGTLGMGNVGSIMSGGNNGTNVGFMTSPTSGISPPVKLGTTPASNLAFLLPPATPTTPYQRRASGMVPNSPSVNARREQAMAVERQRIMEKFDPSDPESITVIDLKKMLREHGINSTGKKATLIERFAKLVASWRDDGRYPAAAGSGRSAESGKHAASAAGRNAAPGRRNAAQ